MKQYGTFGFVNLKYTTVIWRHIPDCISLHFSRGSVVKFEANDLRYDQNTPGSRCNGNKSRFIEISLKSLVYIWVTFPLPTIIVYSNNMNYVYLSLDPEEHGLVYVDEAKMHIHRPINRPSRRSTQVHIPNWAIIPLISGYNFCCYVIAFSPSRSEPFWDPGPWGYGHIYSSVKDPMPQR